MKVTTIIPAHNAERFLEEALQSVRRQRYSPLEIIVVDDGSTDGTRDVVTRHEGEVRYVFQHNAGPSAARNKGLSLATGDAIAFLDADDLWAEGMLARQVAVLRDQPSVDIVQGLIQRMRLASSKPGTGPLDFEATGKPYYFVNLGSALYRRSVFDTVGSFDEELWENEDTDWFFRAWELNIGKLVREEVVLLYRIHDSNMILSQQLVGHGIPRLFKGHLDRMRADSGGARRMAQLESLSAYIGWRQVPKDAERE